MLPRRRLAGAAVLAALLAMLLVPMPRAVAATPSAHGYWWRLQPGSGPVLPPPPFVPNGGLWVANDASGQQAVSAVRYRAPRGVEIRRLDLRVAQSSGQGALMLACAAREAWTAVQAGRWDQRPATRCDVAFVRGTLSRGIWSFDVRGLGRSGTLDVVILPPPGLNATFSIAFERPDVSTVVTQRLPGSPSPTSVATDEEIPTPNGRPRATPSVLGTKTTPPGSPSAVLPPGSPLSSPSTSSPGLVAAPFRSPGDWRRLAVTAIAGGLALLTLAGLVRYRKPSS